MDLDLKQKDLETTPSAKLPKLLLQHHHLADSNPSALTLFVPEPTSNLSATKFNRMGSYFSLAQWQELELQALIFRHMIAGATVPQELLHLVKKSLVANSPSPSSSYYLSHSLHHYYPHYPTPMLQSGYWGRAAMDPEPGRCRRTDGKKWRCSRDVVAGQKYCERHVHRGRNRSRKPVELPTSTAAAATPYGGKTGSNGGEVLKINNSTTSQGMIASDGGGGTPRFTLSGPSPSLDLLHLNHRPSGSMIETKCSFETQNDGQHQGGPTLRHFFDGWPRPLDETTTNTANSVPSATNLSISMPGNPSSDFSLKLGTSSGDELGGHAASLDRDRIQLSWGGTWEANPVAPMGGPLAEALRLATSNSSPTSVLHRLPPGGPAPRASYVST